VYTYGARFIAAGARFADRAHALDTPVIHGEQRRIETPRNTVRTTHGRAAMHGRIERLNYSVAL